MRLIWTLIILTATGFASYAQDFDRLYQDFDPKAVSTSDKKYIQMSLAFLGTYEALIDGKWGRGSQSAVTRYLQIPASGRVTNRDIAELVDAFHRQYGSEGWDYVYDVQTGLSFLAPAQEFLQTAENAGYRTWTHTRRPIEYLMVRGTQATASQWHKAILDSADAEQDPYVVRRNTRWVTSVTQQNGNATYARSEMTDGQWSTIIVSSRDGAQDNAIKAVAGSIRAGRADPLTLNSRQGLGQFLALNRAFKGGATPPQPPQARTGIEALLKDREPVRATTQVTGAGLVVNSRGVVLTSLSNVASCTTLKVAGRPATLLAQSEPFGLAALATDLQPGSGGIARFSARPIAPNAKFAIAGYQPADFWTNMMLERGTIGSDLGTGLFMELTGSISGGYSGGPVLNTDGGVVAILQIVPSNAQTQEPKVRALHGEIAKLFMAQNKIGYAFMGGKTKLPAEGFQNAVQQFTMPIECARP